MGPAGAGSLVQVMRAALASRGRFEEMRTFFEGVGTGHASGVWEDVPREHREFREARLVQLRKRQSRNDHNPIGSF
jgi:chlorophyllide a reductase subunit Y